MIKKWRVSISVTLLALSLFTRLTAISSLASNDPFPMYASRDPREYLNMWELLKLIGIPLELTNAPRTSITIAPFGQNSTEGRNLQKDAIPLGDLDGRWNMIALLYGKIPSNGILSPTLQIAFDTLFPDETPGTVDNPVFIDPAENFGFFSIPLDYRKKGVRFQLQTMLWCDFGLQIQTGVSDICQHPSQVCKVNSSSSPFCFTNTTCGLCMELIPGFHNRTCCTEIEGCPPDTGICRQVSQEKPVDPTNVNNLLMGELPTIADELCLNIKKFHKVSPEDIRLSLFWRQIIELNRGQLGWPSAFIIPYFEIGGSVATGIARDPNTAFALPFGNNGHHSIGGLFGIDFSFPNSITIGAETGATHFFNKTFCNMPVPTSLFQSGIYPFRTNVTIAPGQNWFFGVRMSTHHFLERLSFYFEYLIIHHEEDKLCLDKPDPAFLPQRLEALSCWKIQMANISLYYDISPQISLGFLCQTPLTSIQHAYRSTTVLFSFDAKF